MVYVAGVYSRLRLRDEWPLDAAAAGAAWLGCFSRLKKRMLSVVGYV